MSESAGINERVTAGLDVDGDDCLRLLMLAGSHDLLKQMVCRLLPKMSPPSRSAKSLVSPKSTILPEREKWLRACDLGDAKAKWAAAVAIWENPKFACVSG